MASLSSHRGVHHQPPSMPASSSSNVASNMPKTINRLMRDAANGVDVSAQLTDLKNHIILDGIDADEAGMSQYRIYIWLLLLRVPVLPYDDYAALLARGASPAYSKISNDTFRTLATDPLFARRVSQNSICRLLNAIAWTLHDAQNATPASAVPLPPSPQLLPSSPPSQPPPNALDNKSESDLPSAPVPPPPQPQAIYLQGMNVLAAPLLYASRSEPQAHALLSTLLTIHLPAYIQPTMPGVHRGLYLLDRLLALLDPSLHAHFAAKRLTPSLYAFPSILTLSACTPPLPEVLILWDFLFAWGVHLNVLAVVAQLHLMRDKLLASDSPGREVRSLGPLRGREVVSLVLGFVGSIDESLWKELVSHTAI